MRKLIICLLLMTMLGCMVCIFAFSSQNAEKSNNISMSVSERIAAKKSSGAPQMPDDAMWQFNGIVRKYAHFALFFVLGALCTSLFLVFMPKRKILPIFLALLVCLLWASADEIHQLYVPGRTGQVKDVLIDFSGAFIASVPVLAVRCIIGAISSRICKNKS